MPDKQTAPKVGHTPGPWRAIPQGGSSTVLAATEPGRNDTRIGAYGYDPKNGYCIAYPFLEERAGRPEARLDFVCFSHADARLIAAAPELLHALKEAIEFAESQTPAKRIAADWRALVAKATGGAQ